MTKTTVTPGVGFDVHFVADAGDGNIQGVAATQEVVGSTLNSSTANLASGASFTGASESTLGVAGIQLNLYADQATTIQLQQSTDGTNWDQKGSTTSIAFNTGFYRTYQATGSFFRVIVTNAGLNATTVLRLQTALCPMVETLPTELSEKGNLKISVEETVGALEENGNLAKFVDYSQQSQRPLLQQILTELKIITAFLGQGLNVKDEPEKFRSDPSYLN